MKTYKRYMFFLFLITMLNLKLYSFNLKTNNTKECKSKPIFKAKVILNNLKYKKEDKANRKFEIFALMDEINTAIKNKEIIITNSYLIKKLIDFKHYYPKNICKVFSNKKHTWNIFGTKDKNFIILIPNSKYPEIKTRKDLEQIGLNSKNTFTIRVYNKSLIKDNLIEILLYKNKTKDIKYLRKIIFTEDLLNKIELTSIAI